MSGIESFMLFFYFNIGQTLLHTLYQREVCYMHIEFDKSINDKHLKRCYDYLREVITHDRDIRLNYMNCVILIM